MIYRFGITTPASTLPTDKQRTDLKIAPGVIHQIDLTFPSGPQGYLHCQINHGLFQVWPTNPDEDFASSNEKISFKEFYEILPGENLLYVYTWNLDDTYPHKVIIRIGVLPKEALDPWLTPWSERTKELYGE